MELSIRNTYQNKDGRWRSYCVDENGEPHIVSYPRLLMEQKLGRPLEPNEDVHHIDEDYNNNDIDNLEVILHGEHQRKHSQKYINTIEKCMICGKMFQMSSSQWSLFMRDIRRNRHRILTCGKTCAGKASSFKYPYLYDLNDRLKEVEKLWLS
jgi:hypothetical protein